MESAALPVLLLCSWCRPIGKKCDEQRLMWKESVIAALLKLQNLFLILQIRRALRVVSLFDGIGTGLYILKYVLGIEVEAYFSCEIDEAAMALVDTKFFGLVTHLGPVSNMSLETVRDLCPIDLLIGGSPCNQFSRANPLRKGFDPEDTGALFFDFVKTLKLLQGDAQRRGRPLFFLYENVASMPTRMSSHMSRVLQCEPVMRDGIDYLPAHRKRLFWGNIPGLHDYKPPQEDSPRPCLADYLSKGRQAAVQTLPTLTTTYHSQLTGNDFMPPVIENGSACYLNVHERERLFGFPTNYTDGADLSRRQREELLGRSWTVPVVQDILKPLKELFKCS